MRESTESAFRLWLKRSRLLGDTSTRDTISRCRRVERHYGDLDELFDQGRIAGVLEVLCCSPSGQPLHRIPFRLTANPVTGTASIKSAVAAYREFRIEQPRPAR